MGRGRCDRIGSEFFPCTQDDDRYDPGVVPEWADEDYSSAGLGGFSTGTDFGALISETGGGRGGRVDRFEGGMVPWTVCEGGELHERARSREALRLPVRAGMSTQWDMSSHSRMAKMFAQERQQQQQQQPGHASSMAMGAGGMGVEEVSYWFLYCLCLPFQAALRLSVSGLRQHPLTRTRAVDIARTHALTGGAARASGASRVVASISSTQSPQPRRSRLGVAASSCWRRHIRRRKRCRRRPGSSRVEPAIRRRRRR
eukprot:COSAG01_NODE_8620_length_2716_cov_2.207410_2_plen_257_part_00